MGQKVGSTFPLGLKGKLGPKGKLGLKGKLGPIQDPRCPGTHLVLPSGLIVYLPTEG